MFGVGGPTSRIRDGSGPEVRGRNARPIEIAFDMRTRNFRRVGGVARRLRCDRGARMTSLEDLFHVLLQQVYSAEQQLLKALPTFARRSSDPKLIRALIDHESGTEGHVERLEQVFEMIGVPAADGRCDVVAAIVA